MARNRQRHSRAPQPPVDRAAVEDLLDRVRKLSRLEKLMFWTAIYHDAESIPARREQTWKERVHALRLDHAGEKGLNALLVHAHVEHVNELSRRQPPKQEANPLTEERCRKVEEWYTADGFPGRVPWHVYLARLKSEAPHLARKLKGGGDLDRNGLRACCAERLRKLAASGRA
jgi:hypothetical protein